MMNEMDMLLSQMIYRGYSSFNFYNNREDTTPLQGWIFEATKLDDPYPYNEMVIGTGETMVASVTNALKQIVERHAVAEASNL